MFGKLIVVVAVIAAAYWYWSGPYQQQGRPSGAEVRLQENARTMERCLRRESSMAASAGMAGVGGVAGNAEALCAEQHNLYQQDGQWHSYDAGSGD